MKRKDEAGSIGRARPIARIKGLVVEELEDEILIYDTERDKAHCLNSTAARIWKKCDGKCSVAEIEHAFATDMPIESAREVVGSFLMQLARLHLLADGSLPFERNGIHSRRELLRKIGIGAAAAAIVLPLVTSLVAPTPAAAASCGSHSCSGGGGNLFCFFAFGCPSCRGGKCSASPPG